MRARFILSIWALAPSFAICATAQSAPAATPTAPALQPFFGISSITTLDNRGTVTSTTCCGLLEVDASGRRMTAHIDSANFGATVRRASITDPIALKLITIDYGSRMASVTLLPAAAAARITPSEKPFTSDDPDRGDAGEKVIDGIKVHGYIWVTKAPDNAGSTAGSGTVDVATRFNPSAYPITNEWWWSPELRVFPLITQVDANGNKWIQKYEKIEVKEPSGVNFSIPPGFRVTTITAPPDTH